MSAKTWGPFSGSQLTIIILGVALCFAIPGGLWAAATVQYSFVSLYDAKSKQVAKLGAGGAIKVTNGVGPLVVSDGAGPLTVDGNVTDTAPANLVHYYTSVVPGAGTCTRLLQAPAGSAIVLKQAFIDVYDATASGNGEAAALYLGASNCFDAIVALNPPGVGVTAFPLAPGIVVPPGMSLWGAAYGTVHTIMYGVGYLVPASSVSAPASVAAAR